MDGLIISIPNCLDFLACIGPDVLLAERLALTSLAIGAAKCHCNAFPKNRWSGGNLHGYLVILGVTPRGISAANGLLAFRGVRRGTPD